MDTAQHHPAAPRCLVFLHPAAASNPQVIREIHAATGLIAVAGGNPHAARLVPTPAASRPSADHWGPFGGGAA